MHAHAWCCLRAVISVRLVSCPRVEIKQLMKLVSSLYRLMCSFRFVVYVYGVEYVRVYVCCGIVLSTVYCDVHWLPCSSGAWQHVLLLM